MEQRAYKYTEEEYYERFGKNSCPVCGSKNIKQMIREKSGKKYIVYTCGFCDSVIKREFK